MQEQKEQQGRHRTPMQEQKEQHGRPMGGSRERQDALAGAGIGAWAPCSAGQGAPQGGYRAAGCLSGRSHGAAGTLIMERQGAARSSSMEQKQQFGRPTVMGKERLRAALGSSRASIGRQQQAQQAKTYRTGKSATTLRKPR